MNQKEIINPRASVWNSLEIAKMAISTLTPLMILWLTLSTNRRLQEGNNISENNTRVYNYRENIYKQIGPMLNDLYCYHMYVGHWKELSPKEIIGLKRNLDRISYVNSPYFDSTYLKVYNSFMDACFQTHNRMGGDAKIKSEFLLHRDYATIDTSDWSVAYKHFFTEEDNRDSVFTRYNRLLALIAKNLKLEEQDIIKKQPDQKPPAKAKH